MAATLPATDVVKAYRSLYRALLHAVQYSAPARYTARDQLRKSFRRKDFESIDQERISKTVEFLQAASRETGLEHKIVRNLLQTAWSKDNFLQSSPSPSLLKRHLYITSSNHYDMTLAMLNDSMGLCLR